MKNLLKMSLLALVIAGGVACKEDKTSSTPPTNNTKSVEGEWEMTKYEQDGENKMNGSSIATYNGTGSNFDGTINFKSDNTYESNIAYDFTMKITSPFGNQTITERLEGFEATGDWKVDANGDLEFTSTDSTNTVVSTTMEIASQTATEMVLKLSESFSETDSTSGFVISTTANANITLKKK